MARQPIIRPASCSVLTFGEIQSLRSFYGLSSIRLTVNVYNLSSYPITYYDPNFGVMQAHRLTGEHGRLAGVHVVMVLEVPTDGRGGTLGVSMNELINAAVAQGNVNTTGNTVTYQYAFQIMDHTLLPGVIHKDPVTGTLIGVGDCDWPSVTRGSIGSFGGRDSKFRGKLQAIEFVDDHRECVYLAGVKTLEVIRAVPTHIAAKQPGVYVTTVGETGELEVKSYTTCELCRSEENFALFEKHHEAEAFLDRSSMPSPKKAGSSGPARSMSERLKERADRFYTNAAQSTASGGRNANASNAGPSAFDRRSRYEQVSGGRSWLVVVMEFLESIAGHLIRKTHKEGFGMWFSEGGTK